MISLVLLICVKGEIKNPIPMILPISFIHNFLFFLIIKRFVGFF